MNVSEVNDLPTLNTNAPLTIAEDDGLQTVLLTGIGSGAPNENQTLNVTATTLHPTLLANLMVNYQSANNTGTLTFTPVSDANGLAQVTVTVGDDGSSNNAVSRSFDVNVLPVNDPPVAV